VSVITFSESADMLAQIALAFECTQKTTENEFFEEKKPTWRQLVRLCAAKYTE
jgi:hypothetical protein